MSEENISTEQPQTGQAPWLPSPDVDSRRTGHLEGPPAEGPPPLVRLVGPGHPPRVADLVWRVDHRATFEALRRGRRRRDGPITISWVSGDPAEPPRVAYTIGRRVGPAVVRNRLRRRLRMLIRAIAPRLQPGAYLIGVAPPAVALTFAQLEAHLQKALKDFQSS